MQGVWHDDPDDPREALAIAEHFQGEWCNGGLSQFFANWEPEDAALVPTALRVIGFEAGAEFIDKAIAGLGPPKEWRDVGHRAMMDQRSAVGRLLAEIDDEMSAYEKTLGAAIVKFECGLAKNSGEEMSE